jgi:hypothetical protein
LAAIESVTNQNLAFKFDRLIVDEAQDIGLIENLVFIDLLLEGGLTGAKTLICGDFDHQGIYLSGNEARSCYVEAIPNIQVPQKVLTNCRNTKSVGEFLVELMNIVPEYDKYRRLDNESSVSANIVNTEVDIYQSLQKILFEYSRKFTNDQIVVLSPQKGQLGNALNSMKYPLTDIRSAKPNHIRWGSIQEFKGMEALAVVLVEFDSHNAFLKETFYIGVTRSIYDLAFIISVAKFKELTKE